MTKSAQSTQPQWLDAQEMSIWRTYLQASVQLASRLDESLKLDGLTIDDYEVLVHLSEADPQRLRMTELSHKVLHSQSRLTQRVDRLQKRGLVCREKCPDDRRGTFACLTDDGRHLIERLAPRHVGDVRRWLIDLIEPDERAVVETVLARVAAATRGADPE